ncbi:MAG TPA: histidine kinase [Nocardioides sp.]|nr:histidine kinase [Nocardioides sp.]
MRVLRAARERIEENCLQRGLLYPWWVPVASVTGQLGCVVAAVALRDALWPVQPVTLAILLVLVSPVVQFGFRRWLPWWLDGLGSAVAVTWLLWVPVDGSIDPAPTLLALITAEAVARDGIRPGFAVWGASYAVLAAAALGPGVPALAIHAVEIEVGFVIGAMLLWQMRALAAEREARARAWQQATTAERERIARDIHDLVAHSLSVTLLHITGARHALRDLRHEGADPHAAAAEVDAALADAEHVGRRAMSDIRRTVSRIADEPASPHALPTAADIAGLVREVDQAGLRVEYDESGDPRLLPPAAGLGLYRIAQESLTNVAKHAPGATATVQLTVGSRGARLVVRNPLAAAPRPGDGAGSGLAGMHARADQLGAVMHAGVQGGEWVVDVRVRPDRRETELPCGRAVPRLGDVLGAAVARPAR